MSWAAIIAYIIDFLGTFGGQVAYILMKKGMIKVENSGLNGTKKKIPFFTCEWLSGFVVLTVASLIHVACLPFCDLVLLSTNTSIGIIINNILSVIYLKEQVVWKFDIIAISLICFGSLLIVLLSKYDEVKYTPDEVKDLIWSTTTYVFMILFVIFTVFTIIQFVWHLRQIKKFNTLAKDAQKKNSHINSFCLI